MNTYQTGSRRRGSLKASVWRLCVIGLCLALVLTLYLNRQAIAKTIYLPSVVDDPAEAAPVTEGGGQAGSDPAPCPPPEQDPRPARRTNPPADCDTRLYSEVLDGRTLDGSDNNPQNAQQGMAGTAYPRVAPATYADGVGTMVSGPSPRYVSNRIYSDNAENIFSEHHVTHWGFVWGQFLDHSIGLAQAGDESVALPFDATDPLEQFQNDLGVIAFDRAAAAPGTGETVPREQINLNSSYIDAFAVYGGTAARLDWLRVGPLDGDPSNNAAELLSVEWLLAHALGTGGRRQRPPDGAIRDATA